MKYYLDSYEDIFDIMAEDLIEGYEECVNYVSDEEGIRELMRIISANTVIVPDLIDFNSEKHDYYYLSINYSEDDYVNYSIVKALDDNGEFYGLLGKIYVDSSIPSKFEDDLSNKPHIKNKPSRVYFNHNCYNDFDYNTLKDSLKIKNDKFSSYWEDDDEGHYISFYSTNDDFLNKILNIFN